MALLCNTTLFLLIGSCINFGVIWAAPLSEEEPGFLTTFSEPGSPSVISYKTELNDNSNLVFDESTNEGENRVVGIIQSSRQRRSPHGFHSGGFGLLHGQYGHGHGHLLHHRPVHHQHFHHAHVSPPIYPAHPYPLPAHIPYPPHHPHSVHTGSHAQASSISANFGGLGVSGAAASAGSGPGVINHHLVYQRK